MKKKRFCFGATFAILLVGLIIYFVPKPLSNHLDESTQITSVVVQRFKTQDGEPIIDTSSYSEITKEQKDRIFALCNQYSYRRTVHTLFSDGSMSGLGDRLIDIFIQAEDTTIRLIAIASTGTISIGNKTYKMSQAEQFMNQMEEILEN